MSNSLNKFDEYAKEINQYKMSNEGTCELVDSIINHLDSWQCEYLVRNQSEDMGINELGLHLDVLHNIHLVYNWIELNRSPQHAESFTAKIDNLIEVTQQYDKLGIKGFVDDGTHTSNDDYTDGCHNYEQSKVTHAARKIIEYLQLLRAHIKNLPDLKSTKTPAAKSKDLVAMDEVIKKTHQQTESTPTHSPDFTSVNWFGTNYIFAKGQKARIVELLWEAWEKGGHNLTQEHIGDKIESNALRFEMAKVFRLRKENGSGYIPHPAWNTLIQSDGKGCYKLVEPEKP